jgi:hypothetical protein
MSISALSTEEHKPIQQALSALREALPGKTDYQIAALFVAATVKLPPYSTLQHALITTVATTAVGAFTLCYGTDPSTNKLSVVLVQRSETGADGKHQYGAIGGYTEPGYYELGKDGPIAHPGEQPKEGTVRENREELLDDLGRPILNLDPSRLTILDDGVDESSLAAGGLATHYSAYAVALTDIEMSKVLSHSRRMQDDEAYKNAVQARSKGEITNVVVLPIEEAAILTPNQFTHPHELKAVHILCGLIQTALANDIHQTGTPCIAQAKLPFRSDAATTPVRSSRQVST